MPTFVIILKYLIINIAYIGLFHRAIAESGTSICPSAMIDDPLQYTKQLAKLLSCPTNDTTELVECLRQVDEEELYQMGLDVMVGACVKA